MPPAARATDVHTCPIPYHVGGPIAAGSPKVLMGYLPAARVGDPAVCVIGQDSIASGSTTVLVDGKPAARMGDPTSHGGTIVAGFPQILIGG
ncbi:PAAR domain-containing protein [Nannocystis bainbridge]|uniref:PAAR domain-containing protein n=1 Tax=Nannocystis bainbridge TaxID=2995303 RepID=A0ABT5E6T2_9BACT|nr:PAAR domain-containing protein [Nannocystis bainbridge]MDC0721566.1 PAAR domain-containing protein [Nannocystis bainbridge]